MYNHARTLLLNQSGEGGSQLIYPGDELIPEDFRPVKLPTYLQVVRSILFGISPDRVMLNYRSCQFLRLIQSTELQSHIAELDKRITYSPFDSRLLATELFQPSAVASQPVEDAAIYINGSDLSPDASGRCEYSYLVSVLSGDLVVQRTVSPEANSRVLPSVAISVGNRRKPAKYRPRKRFTVVWRISGRAVHDLLQLLAEAS